ncbi:hypothetical protein [Streptomyces sp. NPDC059970]|uniref:hypothetical protein n=1 Tax=Streptomyces sp. NPDC059970 TaxID=3347019 RepID=UPI0036AA3CA3
MLLPYAASPAPCELQIAQGNTTGARTTAAAIDTTQVNSQSITSRLAAVRRTLATA